MQRTDTGDEVGWGGAVRKQKGSGASGRERWKEKEEGSRGDVRGQWGGGRKGERAFTGPRPRAAAPEHRTHGSRACPASTSPECSPSGLNIADHARFSACITQEGRSGGDGGCGGGGAPGWGTRRAGIVPSWGTDNFPPSREKREGRHW